MSLQISHLPKLHIRIKITKDGKILRNTIEEGHSWTRNAWNIFSGFSLYSPGIGNWENSGRHSGRGSLMCRQTNGTQDAEVPYWAGFDYLQSSVYAGYGFYNNTTTSTFGVLAGRGDTAFSAEDCELSDLITSGVGAGQFSYIAQELPVAVYNSVTLKWEQSYSRVMNNNSGSSIIVSEVGLISRICAWTSSNTYYLLARDVLETPVTVINGAQLTITYELSSPVFNIDVEDYIAFGTLGSGGYVSNYKYNDPDTLIIVAPVSGGYTTGQTFGDGNLIINCASTWGGQVNTTKLIDVYLALSDIATFCKNANDANLGGFNDWYIPASHQLKMLSVFKDHAPVGEEWTVTNHWSSSVIDTNDDDSKYSPMDGTDTLGTSLNSTLYAVRLIRDCAVGDWTPA